MSALSSRVNWINGVPSVSIETKDLATRDFSTKPHHTRPECRDQPAQVLTDGTLSNTIHLVDKQHAPDSASE